MTYPFTHSEQLGSVGEAFSRQSAIFDDIDAANPILEWMRCRVRRQVLKYAAAGSPILELNAGTGLDAIFFAERGFTVHATDIADGMLLKLAGKVESSCLEDKITFEKRSYTQLHALKGKKFDCIFSNFGGLNCVSDLRPVISQFDGLINSGAHIVLVVMPPVSPWEVGAILKGRFKHAFRRFDRSGAPAKVEGSYFKTWYFSPQKLIRAFGKDYTFLGLQSLGSLVPPPHMEGFVQRYPRLFKALCRLEERLGSVWPFNRWTDHFILSMKFTPEKTK